VKIFYLWDKHTIRKVDEDGKDLLKEDTAKKPEIPFLSGFAKLHANFLKKRTKHHGRKLGRD